MGIKTNQGASWFLSHCVGREGFGPKFAHKQNEKEVFMRTSRQGEKFGVKTKISPEKLEGKTEVQHSSLETEENNLN